MLDKLKSLFFPKVGEDSKRFIDENNVNNLYRLSGFVAVFELIAFIVYIVSRKVIETEDYLSMGSVLFCTFSCIAAFITARFMIRRARLNHEAVVSFMYFFYILLTIWAIWVSCRQYRRGEQLLTLFAVELIMACFIPMQPIACIVFNCAAYAGLYSALYTIDGASGLNIFNYSMLILVSIVVMIVRYHSQLSFAEKSVGLKESNEKLEYMNRHDGLTGLRNRKALEEDVSGFIGTDCSFLMIDIDYFKQINDNCGHLVGDEVLKETALKLKELYPDSVSYRYGGDEFLVIGPRGAKYANETKSFSSAFFPDREVVLCIGHSSGVPDSHEMVFELIAKADEGLYEIKRLTHSPEYGGTDRRKRRGE